MSSPKELIARVKRLLARSSEARESRRRALQLERELNRAQDDLRRAHHETRREQRMRELAFELGRELHGSLDIDQVAAQLAARGRRVSRDELIRIAITLLSAEDVV